MVTIDQLNPPGRGTLPGLIGIAEAISVKPFAARAYDRQSPTEPPFTGLSLLS